MQDEPLADAIELGMRHYTLRLPQPTLLAEEDLRGVGVPVLTILAGESVMHDVERSRELAGSVLGSADVVVHPGASQALAGELPEEVAADVAAFLERHAGRPG